MSAHNMIVRLNLRLVITCLVGSILILQDLFISNPNDRDRQKCLLVFPTTEAIQLKKAGTYFPYETELFMKEYGNNTDKIMDPSLAKRIVGEYLRNNNKKPSWLKSSVYERYKTHKKVQPFYMFMKKIDDALNAVVAWRNYVEPVDESKNSSDSEKEENKKLTAQHAAHDQTASDDHTNLSRGQSHLSRRRNGNSTTRKAKAYRSRKKRSGVAKKPKTSSSAGDKLREVEWRQKLTKKLKKEQKELKDQLKAKDDAKKSQENLPLPAGWSKDQDPKTKKYFYWPTTTRKTQWTHPGLQKEEKEKEKNRKRRKAKLDALSVKLTKEPEKDDLEQERRISKAAAEAARRAALGPAGRKAEDIGRAAANLISEDEEIKRLKRYIAELNEKVYVSMADLRAELGNYNFSTTTGRHEHDAIDTPEDNFDLELVILTSVINQSLTKGQYASFLECVKLYSEDLTAQDIRYKDLFGRTRPVNNNSFMNKMLTLVRSSVLS